MSRRPVRRVVASVRRVVAVWLLAAVAAGSVSASPAAAQDAQQPPAKPTGLTVDTESGSLEVALDWDDIDGATDYLVRWRPHGPGQELNDGVRPTSSDADITVADHGQWVVRVQACNAAGCGRPAALRFDVEAPPETEPETEAEPETEPAPDPVSAEPDLSEALQQAFQEALQNQQASQPSAEPDLLEALQQELLNQALQNQQTAQPPAEPTGLRASAEPGSMDVSLDWDDVAGADSYTVQWRQAGDIRSGGQMSVQSSDAAITVRRHGQWLMQVTACNDSGCGQGALTVLQVEPVPAPTPCVNGDTVQSPDDRTAAAQRRLTPGAVASTVGASQVIQAHEFFASSGTVAVNSEAPDYSSVGSIGAGDWICFDRVRFQGSPDILMVFLAAGSGDAGDRIEVRLDGVSGTKIADLTIADTGGNRVFSEQYASVSGASGVHDVYLVFPSATQANINWFVFSQNPDGETDSERGQRIQWWRDARFGQFVHWGPYSHLAGSFRGRTLGPRRVGEWIMYDLKIPINDYETDAAVPFNPTKFNAAEWAKVAKDAGQKYVVVTSKHHDGFSIYDTNVRGFQTKSPTISPAKDYDITDINSFGRDPIAELAEATRAQGLKFGLYYSLWDWHFTDAAPLYLPAMKEQLRELIEKYDPVLLWFDGDNVDQAHNWTRAKGEALYKYLRVLKPDLVINDRVAKREFLLHGDGDYDTTAERSAPVAVVLDWEKLQTMNDTWGFRSTDTNWKPTSQYLDELVSVTSKDGNYLLNIGPDGTGVIPAASVTSLKTVGDWLDVHGPAIYDTDKPNPLGYSKPSWGWYTTRGNTVYAIVKDWPTSGELELEHLDSTVTRVTSLSSPGETYGIRTTGRRVTVTGLPTTAPNSYLSVLELSIEGTVRGRHNLAYRRPVTVSDFLEPAAIYDGAKALDQHYATRWATNDGVTAATLTVDLDGSQTFNRIFVREPWDPVLQRVTSYTVEYWNGTAWVNLHTGTSIGLDKSITFTAVSGSKVRLSITGASDPPTIVEFQVWNDPQ